MSLLLLQQQSWSSFLLWGGIRCQTTDQVTQTAALVFGLAASSSFVGSLYVLVPKRVCLLPRNDKRQIKWRALASGLVCLGTAAAYHVCFCQLDNSSNVSDKGGDAVGTYQLIRWTLSASVRILVHVGVLYLGPLVQSLTEVYVHLERSKSLGILSFFKTCYKAVLEPLLFCDILNDPSGQELLWVQMRNLLIAPMTEEFVFRGFIVPALLASGMKTTIVCWIAPLFFGVAHAHHAIRRIVREGEPSAVVLVQTVFQLSYTTLFGAYTSYAYIQTKSLFAVVLSHSFCNWMGLPNLAFFRKTSQLHGYRHFLVAVHVVGLVAFFKWFNILTTFPNQDILLYRTRL